jgi:RNA polymerase sigma-70 factor (ECF subfamily)
VAFNQAVAVAEVEGPRAALGLVDGLRAELDSFHVLHAVRADLLRRLGRRPEAMAVCEAALAVAGNAAEAAFLRRRLAELREE